MTEFTTVAGVIFIVIAVWLFIVGLYLTIFSSRATDTAGDDDARVTKGERQGAIAVSVIQMIVGILLGVWGVILILPQDKTARLGSAGRVLRFNQGVQFPQGSIGMSSPSASVGGATIYSSPSAYASPSVGGATVVTDY